MGLQGRKNVGPKHAHRVEWVRSFHPGVLGVCQRANTTGSQSGALCLIWQCVKKGFWTPNKEGKAQKQANPFQTKHDPSLSSLDMPYNSFMWGRGGRAPTKDMYWANSSGRQLRACGRKMNLSKMKLPRKVAIPGPNRSGKWTSLVGLSERGLFTAAWGRHGVFVCFALVTCCSTRKNLQNIA